MADIIVKAKPGDVVIAKGEYSFMGETHVKPGQEWLVKEISGLFVSIERGEDHFWLGDINFVELFE